jgi:hypothetical protein
MKPGVVRLLDMIEDFWVRMLEVLDLGPQICRRSWN